MSTLTWDEDPAGSLRLTVDGAEAAVLALGTDIEPLNTPKPHIHPLRTPAGVTVTGFAPEDHPWHHGLQLAMPRVNDHNLWGGGTYLDPQRGYEVIANHGLIEHVAWTAIHDGATASASESLRWDGLAGELLLTEERTWRFRVSDSPAAYVIDLDTRLSNATEGELLLETPAQNGRSDGGYGGLFLRLQEGFALHGLFGRPGTDVQTSGARSDTLVVQGTMAGGSPVTLALAFVDGPTPGTRTWLHRFDPFAASCWAVAYDEALRIPAGGHLKLQHRLAVLDGHVDPAAAEAVLTDER